MVNVGNKRNCYLLDLRKQIRQVRKEILLDFEIEPYVIYKAMVYGLKSLDDFISKALYTIRFRLDKEHTFTLLYNYYKHIAYNYESMLGFFGFSSYNYRFNYFEIQYYQLRCFFKSRNYKI